MRPHLVPESEDFLYCSPETIGGYPQRSAPDREALKAAPVATEAASVWRTLSRQGFAALVLGFGAGMFASAALSLVLLLLSAG